MKILSKYKDYYDYQIGLFGEDPHLILDRREGRSKDFYLISGVITLFIGNKAIQGTYRNQQFYWGKELEQFARKDSYISWYTKQKGALLLLSDNELWSNNNFVYQVQYDAIHPALLENYEKYCKQYAICLYIGGSQVIPFPQLITLGINKMIAPKEIWVELSNYLSIKRQGQEKSVPIGDDKLRIQAHGFDLKSSFRNIK